MKNKILLALGVIFLISLSMVSANNLETDIYQPLFINMVCAGTNPSADIVIYSGTERLPENLVVIRTPMDKISDKDFTYTATFNTKGTYTAFEECSYDGGFISTQTTTITVTDPSNLIGVSTKADYQYEANLFYDVYFKENPTLDDVIDFEVTGDKITFTPLDLGYSNKKKIQTINSPLEVTGYVSGNTFIYQDVYGQGLDLQYLVNKNYVKEELVINNKDNLPIPNKKLMKKGDTSKVNLELNSLMTTTTNHIIVDGKEWKRKKAITTSNIIFIKNNAGDIIYQLKIPVAFDSNGAKMVGSYTLEEVNDNNILVTVKMPYAWFVDTARVYPIFLDPTIDTPDGTGVFDDSIPQIIVANVTIPAGTPYTITEQIMKGNQTILDAECELDIINVDTQEKVVDYRSFYNDGNGNMLYTWKNPTIGNFLASQYCWKGDTLVLNKIYSISTIGVI